MFSRVAETPSFVHFWSGWGWGGGHAYCVSDGGFRIAFVSPGFVTPEEFRAALAAAEPPVTGEERVRRLWAAADTDQLGDLSLGRLSAWLAL